eukprot:181781_1
MADDTQDTRHHHRVPTMEIMNDNNIQDLRQQLEQLQIYHRRWKRAAIASWIVIVLLAAGWTSHALCIPICCFGSETNQLLVEREGIISNITLSNLQIGDYVQSRNMNDDIIWSKVWFINEHTGKHKMIQLSYSYNDGNQFGNLTLTGEHLLYRNEFELVRADRILIGDAIKLTNYIQNDTFVNGEVIDISYIFDAVRAPITMDGDIVVSSVLSSSYSRSKANADGIHTAARFLRDVSDINTKFASFITNIIYNFMYRLFRAISMEHLFEYYAFIPTLSA